MVLAKLDSSILEIRGRCGGVYFRKGPDGQHIQAHPRLVNYQRSALQVGHWGEGSPFASSGSTGFSGAAAFWMMALCGYFSVMWALYAATYLFTNPEKRDKSITGYNWYIYYSLTFAETEHPPFWKPPHSPRELPPYMITHYGLNWYKYAPPDWPGGVPQDYYWRGLTHNGQPSYRTDLLSWYLWWTGEKWCISEGLDYFGEGKTFFSPDEQIEGRYFNEVTRKYATVYGIKQRE